MNIAIFLSANAAAAHSQGSESATYLHGFLFT
jgi:hypothetical protein